MDRPHTSSSIPTFKICSECGIPASTKTMTVHWKKIHPRIYEKNKQYEKFYLECGTLPRTPHLDWATLVMRQMDKFSRDAISSDAYYKGVRESIRNHFRCLFYVRF
jgi:hypothetical protein